MRKFEEKRKSPLLERTLLMVSVTVGGTDTGDGGKARRQGRKRCKILLASVEILSFLELASTEQNFDEGILRSTLELLRSCDRTG